MALKRSTVATGVVLLLAVVAVALVFVKRGGDGRPGLLTSPVPAADHDSLVAFVKFQACEPSACDQVVCENLSDGQTKGAAAHIVRCRWSDSRDSVTGIKCAYAHYAADAATKGMAHLFLSERTSGDTCQPDKAFIDLMKEIKYSGPLP